MGKIHAVCVSEKKGTEKHVVEQAELITGHGINGDAHAGAWHRQVSFLAFEKIEKFRELALLNGKKIEAGAFGENIVADGIDFSTLPAGALLSSGDILFEITQIGKECHDHCHIFETVGDCIMPREGVFARVLQGGKLKCGMELNIAKRYRVGIITASDKGARGEREDTSAAVIRELVSVKGYEVVSYKILSDEQRLLEDEMKRLADGGLADLILTTGGTGFSPRDCTPEAALAVASRLAPGIAEAMRRYSLDVTPRAMLSRAVSVIRRSSLIVNLPGSPKAVNESLSSVIDSLRHGLDILTGTSGECGAEVSVALPRL
ncbi:MAG: molybdenum cofactor biosynthesis protein [Spirochaetaceae bacterium]|jgi:molybdenum cofactor synthesis domain-containing protein|nr:molybdenum cofactor biosynthesis protein [Spirochaetaceae bacterium]